MDSRTITALELQKQSTVESRFPIRSLQASGPLSGASPSKSLPRKAKPERTQRTVHEELSVKKNETPSKRSRRSTIDLLKRGSRQKNQEMKAAYKRYRRTKAPPLTYSFCNKYEGFRLGAPLKTAGKKICKSLALPLKVLKPAMSSRVSNALASGHANDKHQHGFLQICEHWSLYWDEMRQQLRNMKSASQSTTCCGQGFHGLIPPLSAYDGLAEVQLICEEDGSAVVKKHMVLAQLPRDVPEYPPLMLKKRLEQLELSLCPHVFLDRDGIDTHIKSMETSLKREVHEKKCICCGGVHHCPHPFCETSWRVYRRKPTCRADSLIDDKGDENEEGSDIDEVVLAVERRLGRVLASDGRDGNRDESWLSQLEVVGDRTGMGKDREKKWRYNEKTLRLEFS